MSLSQIILNSWSEVQEEPASHVNYTVMNGRDLRELAYSSHDREGSSQRGRERRGKQSCAWCPFKISTSSSSRPIRQRQEVRTLTRGCRGLVGE